MVGCPTCGCEVTTLFGDLGSDSFGHVIFVRCRACHTERVIRSIEIGDEILEESDDIVFEGER